MRICDSPTPINELINNNYKCWKTTGRRWLGEHKKRIFVCTTLWSHIYIRDTIGKKVPMCCDNDTRIPLCCWHIYSSLSVWTIVKPEYSAWIFSFTILTYYSTSLIISKNFHVLSSFNVNEMGSHWVLLLLYLNIVLSWPEDGRLRPKHVTKYNLIVIMCILFDVCYVLTVHNILYKFDIHNGMASLKKIINFCFFSAAAILRWRNKC